MPEEMKKVLVLFSHRAAKTNSTNYGGFVNTINKTADQHGYQAEYSALDQLEFRIVNNRAKIYDPHNSKDLIEYDLVFFRMWEKEFERATSTAIYLKKNNKPFIDSEVYGSRAFTKLVSYFVLWAADLPIPDTFFGPKRAMLNLMASNADFHFPIILKRPDARKGEDNYLVNDQAGLSAVLKSNDEIEFLLQNFIPNDFDFRFLVFGDKIELIIKRSRSQGHLNNTSAGAEGSIVAADEFSESVKKDVIKAAKVRGCEIAGVDLVVDKETGKHYILEVNKVPQIITGACVKDKIAAFNRYMSSKIGVSND